jgi:hypothetical protein
LIVLPLCQSPSAGARVYAAAPASTYAPDGAPLRGYATAFFDRGPLANAMDASGASNRHGVGNPLS